MKQCIGIKNEHEGVSTLFFDIADPETPKRLFEYIKENIDYSVDVSAEELTDEEFAALDS